MTLTNTPVIEKDITKEIILNEKIKIEKDLELNDIKNKLEEYTKVEKEFTPNTNTQKIHLEAFKKYQEYSKALAPLYTS